MLLLIQLIFNHYFSTVISGHNNAIPLCTQLHLLIFRALKLEIKYNKRNIKE